MFGLGLLACVDTTEAPPSPGSGAWAPMAMAPSSSSRQAQSAAYSGEDLFVWEGSAAALLRYRARTNLWSRTAERERYEPRTIAGSTVWTGRVILTWGGDRCTFVPSGFCSDAAASYDPARDTWAPLPADGMLPSRVGHVALWTSKGMFLWAGRRGDAMFADGALYDPELDRWAAVPPAPLAGRQHARGVLAGDRVIVWGGEGDGRPGLADGAIYDLGTGRWASLTTVGAPSPRRAHEAIWTGSEMIVWGGLFEGHLGDGGAYDPLSDRWRPIAKRDGPSPRSGHVFVWTGSDALLWGGYVGPHEVGDGYRYDPRADRWARMAANGAPDARSSAFGFWTGSALLVWGGSQEKFFLSNTGALFTP